MISTHHVRVFISSLLLCACVAGFGCMVAREPASVFHGEVQDTLEVLKKSHVDTAHEILWVMHISLSDSSSRYVWVGELTNESLEVQELYVNIDDKSIESIGVYSYVGMTPLRLRAISSAFNAHISTMGRYRQGGLFTAQDTAVGSNFKAFAGVGDRYAEVETPSCEEEALWLARIAGAFDEPELDNIDDENIIYPLELGIPWLISQAYKTRN